MNKHGTSLNAWAGICGMAIVGSVCAATALGADPVTHEVRTWTGAGDGCTWGNDANWNTQAPRSQDTAKFTQAAIITSGVDIDGDRTIDIDGGCTVTIAGCISGSNKITRVGAGQLVLTGDNTFSGDLYIQNSYVIARGENALSSSGDGLVTVYKENNPVNDNLVLGGVTVKKPVLIRNLNDGGNNYTRSLMCESNTVNVLEKLLTIEKSYLRMMAKANSKLILAGGTAPTTCDFFGCEEGAEVVVTNIAITHFVYSDTGAITYACAGNRLRNWNDAEHHRGAKGLIRTTVDGAFDSVTRFHFGLSTALLDLCGTTQSISRIEALTKSATDPTPADSGIIRSATPAKMAFNWDNNAYTNSAIWEGAVTFEKNGTGSAFLTAVSTSTGELQVVKGKLVMVAKNASEGASWAGNVSVSGGELGLSHAKALNRKMDLSVSGDGLISIPAGVTVRCANLYVNGDLVPPGVYSDTAATGVIVDSHFTGGGRLRSVGHPGLVLILK